MLGQFIEVPPPLKPQIQPLAVSLGLVTGLIAENNQSQFRCGSCNQYSPEKSVLVWVPDSIRRGDPSWAVSEECRRTAFNGSRTGWCLQCALSLGDKNEQP